MPLQTNTTKSTEGKLSSLVQLVLKIKTLHASDSFVQTKTSEPSLQPIPPLMFNQMRPAGLPNLLSNPLLRFGFQPQASHPILNTTGLYTPMVNPMNMFPKINESLLNPVTLPTVPSVSSIDHAETSPLQSRPTRKRSHSKSSESDQSEKQAKISRIEPKEENPSSATSSSSELTAADISANKSDEAHDSHDEIKVYRNGTEIEISKCDICKCIFLDKVTSSRCAR